MAEVTDSVSQGAPTNTDAITPQAPDISVPNFGGDGKGVPPALDPNPPADAPVTPKGDPQPVTPTPPPDLQPEQAPAPAPKDDGDTEDGVDKMKRLKDAGASDDQISQWKADTKTTLSQAGATPVQIQQYFREPDPNTSAMQSFTTGNMATYPGDPAKDALKPDGGFEARLKHALGGALFDVGHGMEAGFQQSITGMAARGSAPTMQLGPDADFMARTAAGISQLIGDAPVMVPAAIGGTLAGGPVAGGAAAFGVPAAVRKMLIDHYQRGDITTAAEFGNRLVGTAWEAAKGGATGAATSFLGPVGGKIGGALGGAAAGAAGRLATELATMTTVSKGLEGRLPNMQDFTDGAFTLALLHGATGATSPLSPKLSSAQERVATAAMPIVTKLHNIFASTGMHPADVVAAASSDDVLKTQLLSSNPQSPPESNVAAAVPDSHEATFAGKDGSVFTVKNLPEGTSKTSDHTIQALDQDGKVVGSISGIKESGFHPAVQVEEGSRRNGIATALYDYAQKKGINIPAVDDEDAVRTDAGQAFREARGDGGKTEFSPIDPSTPVPALDNVPVDPEHPAVKNFDQVADGNKTDSIAVPTDDSVVPPRQNLNGFNVGFRQKLIDQLDPIRQFTEQLTGGRKAANDLAAGANPYTQAVLFKNVQAKVLSALTMHTSDFQGNETGESYDTVVKDFPKVPQSEPLTDAENKVLESFEPESIKNMSNTAKRANAYLVARRVVNDLSTRTDENGEYIPTGVDPEAAQSVYDQFKGSHEQVAKRTTAFSNRIMDYATEGGLISEESNSNMRTDNVHHTPFFRLQDDDAPSGAGTGGGAYQKMTGSDKSLFPPLDSIQGNASFVIKQVEANRVAQTMVDLNNKAPIENRILSPVEGTVRKINLSKAQLTGMGIDADAIPDKALSTFIGERQPLKDNQIQVMQDGERKVYETDPQLAEAVQGLRQAPAQMSTLAKIFVAPLQLAAAGLRAGTVLNPGFMLRHFERSQMLSTVQGDYAQAPVIDAGKAIGNIVSENGDYEKWYAAGGAVDAQGKLAKYLKSAPWDDSSEENSIWDKSKTSGGFISKALNTIKNPAQMASLAGAMQDSFAHTESDMIEQIAKIKQELGGSGGLDVNPIKTAADALGYVSELSDSSTRLAQFKRQGGADLETGINPADTTDFDKRSRAAMAASQITLNYNLKGQWVQSISAITPFLNVGIQGMDRMVQAFRDNPVSMTAKSIGMITAPTVSLYAVNHDQSWYKQLPDWQKDLYWHYMIDKWEPANGPQDAQARPDDMRRQNPDGSWQVNNGTVYKVPKPFELGVLFGSLPERAMSAYFDENPHAMKGFLGTLGQAVPNVLPTALTPIAEQGLNHVFFTGNDLINHINQDVTPDLQYNDFTSDTARKIGGLLGAMGGDNVGSAHAKISSPAVVENYIRSWTGQLGAQVVQATDDVLRKSGITPNVPKVQSPQNNMFVAAYTERYPQARTQNIEDFQSDYHDAIVAQNSMKKKMEVATQMAALGRNDPAAQKFYTDAQANFKTAADAALMEPKLTAVSKTLSSMNVALHNIREAPNMSSDDKSRATDLIYRQMSQVADQGNQMMAQFQKTLKIKQGTGK